LDGLRESQFAGELDLLLFVDLYTGRGHHVVGDLEGDCPFSGKVQIAVGAVMHLNLERPFRSIGFDSKSAIPREQLVAVANVDGPTQFVELEARGSFAREVTVCVFEFDLNGLDAWRVELCFGTIRPAVAVVVEDLRNDRIGDTGNRKLHRAGGRHLLLFRETNGNFTTLDVFQLPAEVARLDVDSTRPLLVLEHQVTFGFIHTWNRRKDVPANDDAVLVSRDSELTA